MNLLGAKLYDPAAVVSKVTTALLAMTAFDTTNLRLSITVPAHGMVMFRGMVTLNGATTYPVVFLGVLQGSTVVARVTPTDFPGTASAATQTAPCFFEAIVTGLTPGAANFDLAYGVDVVGAAGTAFKYGGPNDTTTTNAFGGARFEAWDPQPQTANTTLAVDANGRVDMGKVSGTAQTAGDLAAMITTVDDFVDTEITDIRNRLPAALVGGRMDASVGNMANNVLTAAAINAAALNGKGDWPLNTDYTAVRAGKLDNLDAAVTSRMATFVYTAPDNATISLIASYLDTEVTQLLSDTGTLLARLTAGRATNLDRLDATISSRFAAASYTAPPTEAQIVDKLLGRSIAGGADGGRTVQDALRALRNKTAIAAGALTVYQEDDVTPAWTAVITTGARDPLSSVDPA